MRRRKNYYRPYEGRRNRTWPLVLLAVLLACALAFAVLLGLVLSGARDRVEGEPGAMVILGCQVKPWGPSVLLQDRLDKALDYLAGHPDLTVVVSGGEVYMESADCPDQLCVRQGRRHRAGEQIICLPNQVAVIIEGATDGGVDAVAQ